MRMFPRRARSLDASVRSCEGYMCEDSVDSVSRVLRDYYLARCVLEKEVLLSIN